MKHHVRGRRDAPQDIHFIVIGSMRTDGRTVSCQSLVYMNMDGRRRRLVFEFFRVNMVERRLQESPQEREHTENDIAGSHSFSLKYHPGAPACVALIDGWSRSGDPCEGNLHDENTALSRLTPNLN